MRGSFHEELERLEAELQSEGDLVLRALRSALNAHGYSGVQIVAADTFDPNSPDPWPYTSTSSVAILGNHDMCGYPTGTAGGQTKCTTTSAALDSGKPLWASELGAMDAGAQNGCVQPCAPAMDRATVRGYIDAKLTGYLEWPVLDAMPPGLPYENLIAPLILAGSGASVAIPATMSAVMTSVPPAAIGQASGTLNMLRQLGGVFGIAICAAVFAARGGYASPAQFTRGFGPALGACAGLALLGAVAGLILPSKQRAAPAAQIQPVPQPRETKPLETRR